MSYQAKIKRYTVILEQLSRAKYPSVQQLINYLKEQGLTVSERQLKRDIESLRFEFGLEIQYSAIEKGYFLESGQMTFPYFLKLLEFAQNSELLTAYLKKGLDISEILDFEDFHSFKGTELLQDMAIYILNNKEMHLTHKRFDAETGKEFIVQPYLLREYLNRWYLVGILSGSDEIRTFGLDRIIRYTTTGQTFKKSESHRIGKLFQHVVGINASFGDQPEVIRLSCHPYLGNLLQSLPLHPSQQLLSESTNETVVELKVVVNYELKQRLMMMADQATVIAPEWLRAEMLEIITQAQKRYVQGQDLA